MEYWGLVPRGLNIADEDNQLYTLPTSESRSYTVRVA